MDNWMELNFPSLSVNECGGRQMMAFGNADRSSYLCLSNL